MQIIGELPHVLQKKIIIHSKPYIIVYNLDCVCYCHKEQ